MPDPAITIAQLKKIAEGREAEMFEWADGKVLRLFRPGRGRDEAERQMAAMQEAAASGAPVPQVFTVHTVEGRHGFVMERLHGRDLLTAIGSQPWRIFHITADCGKVHGRINSAPAPANLPPNHEQIRRAISRDPSLPIRYSDAALARLEQLSVGDRLCHGDFHPGNVMLRNGEPVVIDWTNAARGSAEADFARSRLIVSLGDVPPGTSPALRVLAKFFRRLFVSLYSRAYRRTLTVDAGLVKAWELPLAVGRLTTGIEQERPALTRYIESRLNSG